MDEYSGRVNISDYSGGVPFELHQNLGVNQSSEQTWFSGKNIDNARSFEKLVPGQNTLL